MTIAATLGTPFGVSRLNFYKKQAQYRLQGLLDRKAFFFQSPHHGIADVLDIRPSVSPTDTLIDIGANIGQTAFKFRAAFPKNRIICFEPISETFQALKKRTQGLGVELHQLALGSQSKTETIYLTDFSATSSFHAPAHTARGSEQVQVVTLDDFAAQHDLGQIGLLKIDAEGHDLEVIAGAKSVLSSGVVKFVVVEVGFRPAAHSAHVPFESVRTALSAQGYDFFGLYDQSLDRTAGNAALHYANAMFARH